MNSESFQIRRIGPGGDTADAFAVRRAVFIGEQGIAPEIELDGRDAAAVHYVAVRDGRVVGTARIRGLGPGRIKVERVAVLAEARRHGIGRRIMQCLLDDAAAEGMRRVELSAQLYVADFYRGLGFAADSDPYDEVGIPHVHMVRDL
ncbi:MAG: GNAT family N-acetyltransferase [Rhodospirillales bacterium]